MDRLVAIAGCEQREVDFFRHKGEEGREELERGEQRGEERVARSLPQGMRCIIQALFGELQVVVGQVAPEEALDLAFGRRVVVVLEMRRGALDELLRARQQPAIRGREGWQ